MKRAPTHQSVPAFRSFGRQPPDLPLLSSSGLNADDASAFIKSYMHNGVFKRLKDVVHFYNKRNIAVDASGNEVAFDLRVGPPAGYKPLFPPPEVIDNVQNAAGVTPDNAGSDVDNNGQVGNLQLSSQDEYDIVAFVSTLTDGFSPPSP